MSHAPGWHMLESNFTDANVGITIPARIASSGGAKLRIVNLDRDDPPGYLPGSVPRGAAFNRNVFRLTADPLMPPIPVVCETEGFDPAAASIYWRVVCRHVLCRHSNSGSFRYVAAMECLEREWRGESRAAKFTIFEPDAPENAYTYGDASRVMGGHAVLMVAALVNGSSLLDYVHLRIGGTNPTVQDVYRYLETQLAGYDRNVVNMVRAIYAHESGFQQFAARVQTKAAMTFDKRFHSQAGQPDCRVIFDWPDDPENFPLASFDFGVGLSQFTKVGGQKVTCGIAWDWRENVRLSVNLFLKKLQSKWVPGLTWQHWALSAWAAYNGSGSAAALYAKKLSMSPEGALVSLKPVSELLQIALIPDPIDLPDAERWVVA